MEDDQMRGSDPNPMSLSPAIGYTNCFRRKVEQGMFNKSCSKESELSKRKKERAKSHDAWYLGKPNAPLPEWLREAKDPDNLSEVQSQSSPATEIRIQPLQ
eukprot:545166-Amphidinium_carterae.3